uniref:Uncharacterized protein n=1 Tax=viral metagenome TaxID=1070528 RepID=A0A6C0JWV8_9ZZZZ
MSTHVYNEMTVEFIFFLTNEAFAYVKEMAGFPQHWTRIHVCNWLGQTYDRITLRSTRDNNGPILSSLEVVDPFNHYDERYLLNITIPFQGLDFMFLNYLLQNLLNIDFNNWNDYLNYIESNGRCSLNITMYRYDQTLDTLER